MYQSKNELLNQGVDPGNEKLRRELLTREEAARYLGVSPGTLAVWASTKRYRLPYYKIGAKVFYDRRDLDQFLASCRVDVAA